MNSPDQIYQPKEKERQFTARAILTGCLLGGIVTAMNLYLGLKTGWSIGGSIIAAIISYAIFQLIKPKIPFSVLETNIAQTAGSGAGTMASAAGLLAPIPALGLMGVEISIYGLFFWAISVAFLGVMFAVPLRTQYVEKEKLRFPTGFATATTIVALYSSAKDAMLKAKALFIAAIFAFAFTLTAHFFGDIEKPLSSFYHSTFLGSLAAWGFWLYFNPLMYGVGMIIGHKVGVSLVLGAMVGWSLGYIAQQQGWAVLENPMQIHDKVSNNWGARGWILWPGVAIMVGDAIMGLLLSWKTFITAFKSTKSAFGSDINVFDKIPAKWWKIGLLLSGTLTIVVAQFIFFIPWYLSLLAIALSFILANVAVRSTGETDINPVGGMGKVTQVVFGSISSSITTNLLAAGITGSGASQAADMMQDLKTGHMLGASPKKQFIAQIIGIVAGVLFCVPVYYLFQSAYTFGSEELPVPAAIAWKAVAEVITKGFDSLPIYASEAIFIGVAFGALLPVLRKIAPSISKYTPSGLAFGIAFIVPAFYSLAMFIGSFIGFVWTKRNALSSEKLMYALACGLIVGEGLAGILNAILSLLGY